MIETAQLISDVKEEFEGGSSLAVDWDIAIRKAVENVLDNCRPETLKRTVPLYGGLSNQLYAYYCPEDVLVPSDIFSNDGLRRYSYQPARTFYTKRENNKYTIEYINGKRFLIIRHDVETSALTIDEMDTVGTKTGGTPTLNEHNFLFGDAAIEFTATDAGVTLADTLSTALDITDYLKGVVILPAYLSDASKLASIELRLQTDNSNYYKLLSTSDSIGDYFKDGWNFMRFQMASKTTVGSPTVTNIASYKIIATTESGQTLTIIVDKFTIQKFAPYYFQYYSNRAYVNGSTGALWKATVESATSDKINFDRDLSRVLHYELCIIVNSAASFNAVDGQTEKSFEKQLSRAWENYYSTHPSDEAPLTYSKSPEISMDREADYNEVALNNDTESFINS